jgi:hypothetical protein
LVARPVLIQIREARWKLYRGVRYSNNYVLILNLLPVVAGERGCFVISLTYRLLLVRTTPQPQIGVRKL